LPQRQDERAPEVLISGYYGFGNPGDEAILASMVGALREAIPGLRITVLSADPAKTERWHEVKAVKRTSPLGVLEAILRARLLISGGGGLLQDVTSVRSLAYYLGIIELAKRAGKPTMLYANSFGPIRTGPGRRLARQIVNRMDLITVRDELSLQELVALGINRPPAYLTADPALALEPPGPGPAKQVLAREGIPEGPGPLVAISLRNWRGADRYLEATARTGDYLVDTYGTRVLFLPLQWDQDYPVALRVKEMMNHPSYIMKRGCLPGELLSLTGMAHLVIGMRLHSLIFAAVSKVPMVGIIYDPKVRGFLQQVDQPAAGEAETLDFTGLRRAVDDAFHRHSELARSLDERLPPLREKARRNAELAAALLHGQPL